MTKPVEKTSPRDETETVEVQGSTESEASSHQRRKRYRKAKVVESSSDQPQEGGQETELPPGEKEARKEEPEKKRCKNMMDAEQETREMGSQVEILRNNNAEVNGDLWKTISERLPAITREIETLKEEHKLLNNGFNKVDSAIKFISDMFLQKQENDLISKEIPMEIDDLEITENDLKMSMGIPMEIDDPEGEDDRSSMGLASSESISNGIDDFPPNKLITQGTGSSQTGMSKQYLKQILDELEKLNSKVNVVDSKINALTQGIEMLKKNDKSKDAKEGIEPAGVDD